MSRSEPGADGRAETAGTDFLQLRPEEAPAGGLAEWLAGEFRAAIADGRLPLGSRLPATRQLAAELQVSRGVVTEAYQRLSEDGHVTGRGRAGTIVVATPIGTTRSGSAGSGGSPNRAPSADGRPNTRQRREPAPLRPLPALDAPGQEIFDAMRAAEARIDLTPGVPDLAAFPRAAWLRAERAVLSDLSASAFGYGDPAGTPALRLAVANWLARNRGIKADPADLIIVAGVSQALALIAQVFTRAGITELAVEDPGSLGTRQHLQLWGMRTPPVAVDADGLRIDVLRGSGAPAVLVTPAHQFPTGVVLGGERRRELMQWATDGGLIVEDDYDAEHRYDRPPVPALRAMLTEQVIYTGSISKLLAPALRIGWMLPPPRFHRDLVAAKRQADLGNAGLPQLTVAHLMKSGDLERQLRFVRRRHRARRDAMITAIANHLPTATVHGAAAGLHLTITFDEANLSDLDLVTAALELGVKTQPLSWHCQRPLQPGLVLGYAARTPTEVAAAVATIGEALATLS
ncbi:MocR-like pyridoxine biosynthesis transcription factor PdxR [Kribbella sp. CA-293567]|uniref:MocR-like pyridoxine biosynthesis transcription factor PdxR n=1 Tax=Kribbella sp. CA-293567 TaxID=3002436 RepID=UPI0022DD018A|nr:PLP-dependent aminotransferase family protein [Kribbella sp. CA-293567]WBQ04871.1 PLP-dependent aminotransferase family protein [Kribbella sp. CA-293567]